MIVYLASPLRNLRNAVEYARRAMRHSLVVGEAPIVPHLLYPQVLDDDTPADRESGMAAARELIRACDVAVFYVDHGLSDGMRVELAEAVRFAKPIAFRWLDPPVRSGRIEFPLEINDASEWYAANVEAWRRVFCGEVAEVAFAPGEEQLVAELVPGLPAVKL